MFKAPDEGNYRSCRRDAPQEEQAFDIVDEVRQSDLRLRSRDPDGPDEQTHPILRRDPSAELRGIRASLIAFFSSWVLR
jgi:hypothetical protein